MGLTKRQFGPMLKAKLESTADVNNISRWAYEVFLDNSRQLEPGLEEILLDLTRMQDGAEFEYTKKELSGIAEDLMSR